MTLSKVLPFFSQEVCAKLQSCVSATTTLLDSVSHLPKEWINTGCKEGEPKHTLAVLLQQTFLCSRYAIEACSYNDLYSMALMMRTIYGFHHDFLYLILPQTYDLRYAHNKVFIIHGTMKACAILEKIIRGADEQIIAKRNELEQGAKRHTLMLQNRCSKYIAQECEILNPELPQLVHWVFVHFEPLRDKYLKSENLLCDLKALATRRRGLVFRGESDIEKFLLDTLPRTKKNRSGYMYEYLSTYHHPNYFALSFAPTNRDELMGRFLKSIVEMTYFMAIATHARYFSKHIFPNNPVNKSYHSATAMLETYVNTDSLGLLQ